MSIVRVGLAETKRYASGWDSIFTKKRSKTEKKAVRKSAKPAARKKTSK